MTLDVVVEAVPKRAFASVLRWPGWSRGGKTEAEALDRLLAYAPRYASVVGNQAGRFAPPKTVSGLRVVERLPGNASTEFGAFGCEPSQDAAALSSRELTRRVAILRAAWTTFDQVVATTHTALRTGPRGGGRDLEKIRAHVEEAEAAYLRRLGGDRVQGTAARRDAFEETLHARNRGELAEVGPRGGARWTAAYAIRVAAWHVLDHVWEIEDRRT